MTVLRKCAYLFYHFLGTIWMANIYICFWGWSLLRLFSPEEGSVGVLVTYFYCDTYHIRHPLFKYACLKIW